MKKIILIFLISAGFMTPAFSQDSRWSLEPFFHFGIETEKEMPGLEYGFQAAYSVTDRFGWQASLGSFQSFNFQNQMNMYNSSYMLVSLNLFGDLLKSAKGHTLRLSAGGTYFGGALMYFSNYIGDNPPLPMMDEADLDIYRNIGLNAKLSYLCPLSDKWHLGINLNGYNMLNGKFLQIVSLGCSLGYKL